MPREWVQINPTTVVVSDGSKVRFHSPSIYDPSFREPMTCAGDPRATRLLLGGACVAGNRKKERRPLTLARYAYDLAGAYLTAHATVPALQILARRFAQTPLGEYFETQAREEAGHDLLALADLRALGLPAERVVALLAPAGALELARYHDETARSERPLRCLGYAYCLEWLASLRGADDMAAIRALPNGANAARCFKIHSALGSDVAHVDELVRFIAGLPAEQRCDAVIGCHETAVIIGATDVPESDEIESRLRAGGVELGSTTDRPHTQPVRL